ncbi:MAG: response regulator [Gammaproteobacteria bacterium]
MNNNDKEFSSSFFMEDALSRNTFMYFIFSTLLAFFVFIVINDKSIHNNSLQLWLISLVANTVVLAIFHYLSSFRKNNSHDNIFFLSGFVISGLIWGSLGGLFLPQLSYPSHALVIMSLVAIVALGVPLFSSSSRLVLIFSSVVLLPTAIFYFSESNTVSISKGLILTSLIPVILRVVKISLDFQKRTTSLSTKHKQLIKELNIAIRETKSINSELKHEINDRKKVEKELIKARDEARAAASAKSEFLATMSHEIRTPMNGILGMAELLINTELTNKQARFAETIHKSGTALLTIINDILDFSKFEAGKLELNHTVFDLRFLAEEVSAMFADQAHQKSLGLICDYPVDGHSMFRGDAERIRQILINLIGNAFKFTSEGEVSLQVELFEKSPDKFFVRFRVRDTGIGIEESVQQKIFGSFSQADGTTTRKFGGTGLGLAICKKLTELMQGKIGIKSQPGHGSVFWFAIPLKKEVAVKQPISKTTSNHFESNRLLIVDSSVSNRRVLERQFSNWGLDYYSATNGKTALSALRDANQQGNPFTLAILDNQLPDTDGVSLARKVKNDSSLAEIKIIMLSSVGNIEETGQWLMAGVETYLNKPIRQNELYESVCAALYADKTDYISSDHIQVASNINNTSDLQGHILVAEDNIVNQELAREMIGNLGCTTEILDNGQLTFDAITKYSLDNLHKPYDLILMDCQMPEMDGFEATKQIRAWESQQKEIHRIPIIALTANAMEGDREKCLAAGMDDYMAKPFNLEQLGALLHRWLPLLAKENKSVIFQQNKKKEEQLLEQINEAEIESPEIKTIANLDTSAFDKIRKLQREGQANVVLKVIKLFLGNSQKIIRTLESAISEGDHALIQRSAYSLKSSCSTVGATDLVKICSELEAFAKAEDVEKAQSSLMVLDYEYDAVCAALNILIQKEKEAA